MGVRAFFLGDLTPCRPKGSPLCTILRYPLLATDPKNFLKTPSAPIYNSFEGERAPKKRNFFLSKFLKKLPKNAFFGLFFQNFASGAKNLAKIYRTVLWESSKNQFGRTKEKSLQNIREVFWKSAPPPPPLEKILDPPLLEVFDILI